MVPVRDLDELTLAAGEQAHSQEDDAMLEPGDIGRAVSAFPVPYRHLDDLQVQLVGPEEQVEIPEGIEFSEIGAVFGQFDVIIPEHDLGAAEGIFEALLKQPGKGPAEKMIAQVVQKAHGFFLHGVDQPGPVDEISFIAGDGVVELRQIFRGDGEVCIKDHQDVACGYFIAFSDGVGLSFSFLLPDLDVVCRRIFFLDLLDLFPGIVRAVPFDEDDLCVFAESGQPQDGVLYVPAFIAGRDHHGGGILFGVEALVVIRQGLRKAVDVEAEKAEEREFGQVFIKEEREAGDLKWQDQALAVPVDIEARDVEQVVDIAGAQPVLYRCFLFQADQLRELDQGLPHGVVELYDDLGLGMGAFPDLFEYMLYVAHEPDQVTDHDQVKGLVELYVIGVHNQEVDRLAGVFFTGPADVLFAEIDPHFPLSGDPGQQVAAAAAYLKHGAVFV